MIKTIVRSFNWHPAQIDELYCDSLDFKGMVYWYDDIQKQNKDLDKKKK